MTDLNPMDAALQASAPVVMVPRFEPMTWLQESGHRFLMTSDGVWLEVKRTWLHLVWPLAKQASVAMPYGTCEKRCHIAGGGLPTPLINRFITQAKACAEIEQAAWIVWNQDGQAYRYQNVEVIEADLGRVRYHRPELPESEEMAVDLHSHGTDDAFFSSIDNRDDRGEVKVSIVVGMCQSARPTVIARLCALGLYLDLPVPVNH